ncbi:hypothetical protein ACFZDK_44400 [Streptomyces sp. NPDC007901]|uniref:hypothetical protein n=1 Tax=Streptomyces sp. NPDC007901 TaxID=3364785 RepID=UPI0036F02F8B
MPLADLQPVPAVPRAAAAYEAHRAEAEHFGYVGERAIAPAHRAWAPAFTDPGVADDELDLARRLLTGHDERATTLTAQIAVLVRVAGTRDTDVENHAQRLRTQIHNAGIRAAQTSLELALGFHHAVCGNPGQVEDVLARLQVLTHGGDYAYYIDLVSFMAGLPLASGRPDPPLWLDGRQARGHDGVRWSRHAGSGTASRSSAPSSCPVPSGERR